MPRNGSGAYSLPEAPFTFGTTIDEADVNSNFSDIASALTASVAKDGQTTPTANLPMGGFKHTGVGTGTAATDYGRLDQVQSGVVSYVSMSGTDTYTGTLSPAITSYTTGMKVRAKFTNANTSTTPTANFNSVGAATIKLKNTAALAVGDIAASGIYDLTYDGSAWLQDSPSVTGNAANKLPLAGGTLTGDVTITSTDAGAGEAPNVTLYRDSATPAAADILGGLKFDGEDSGGNQTTYGRIRAVIDDATNGSEDGQIDVRVMVAGTETTIASHDAAGLAITGAISASGTISGTNLASTTIVTAGTYTPTLTNGANIASSTALECQYIRVGSTVFVAGRVAITHTSASAQSIIDISLPIASNFGAAEDCAGTFASAVPAGSGNLAGGITASVANDRAVVDYLSQVTANSNYVFNFGYQVI